MTKRSFPKPIPSVTVEQMKRASAEAQAKWEAETPDPAERARQTKRICHSIMRNMRKGSVPPWRLLVVLPICYEGMLFSWNEVWHSEEKAVVQ
jgi:hypothetical protein